VREAVCGHEGHDAAQECRTLRHEDQVELQVTISTYQSAGGFLFTSCTDIAVLRIRDIFVCPGSRIPDPKTATKERGEKKFVVQPFL
jgi:hypothetical protein